MSDNPLFPSTLPSAEKRVRQAHALEWQEGWQYAVVHRTVRDLTPEDVEQAKKKAPPELAAPPPGKGWHRNTYVAAGAYRAEPPSWCKDDTVLMLRVYWYRSMPGMKPYDRRHRISVRRDPE